MEDEIDAICAEESIEEDIMNGGDSYDYNYEDLLDW